jgi:hypothetical protein
LFPDDARIGTKAALPEAVADDRDVHRFGLVFIREKRATEKRLHPENIEERVRHARARDSLRLRPIPAEIGAGGPIGGGRGEEIPLLRPIGEIEIRNVAIGDPVRGISTFEIDDAFRLREWQRTAVKPLCFSSMRKAKRRSCMMIEALVIRAEELPLD